MITADVVKLQSLVDQNQTLLREGLLATDIWDPETGLSLAGHNPQPAATALFNRVTDELRQTLIHASYPALNRYYLVDLTDSKAVLIIMAASLRAGLLLDTAKANMGVLMGVVLPSYLKGIADSH